MVFIDGDHRTSLDYQSASSTFYIDPLNAIPAPHPPLRQTNSMNMFPTSSSANPKVNNHQSTFYYQPSPSQFQPTRPPPPPPVPVNVQSLTLKNLNINPVSQSNDVVTDLLDLGDPGSPPPSPKFDPFG